VQDVVAFLPLIGIALVFWLLVIRPQSRRQRELRNMQSTLEVGERVMLTSGVYGTLREVGEETVGVEIADGVTITVARGAVGQVVEREQVGRNETDETDETAGPAAGPGAEEN
jgi:preprotein translocase subunit YajC